MRRAWQDLTHRSLRVLYGDAWVSISRLYAQALENVDKRRPPCLEILLMSVLDGLFLLLAIGLFVYLLVALLRASGG